MFNSSSAVRVRVIVSPAATSTIDVVSSPRVATTVTPSSAGGPAVAAGINGEF